jgi:hypothetical protein
MSTETLRGKVKFEESNIKDLLSALDSLGGVRSSPIIGVVIPSPGVGYHNYLKWALADVREATVTSCKEEVHRLSTTAVMHARRALDCLIEQYMIRDCISHCEDPPKKTKPKNDYLLRRNIIDELTKIELQKLINLRNEMEHEFSTTDLDSSQRFVEFTKLIIPRMVERSNPSLGPCFFGSIMGGYGTKENRMRAWFSGWGKGPHLALSRLGSKPWIGILMEEDSVNAFVRRVSIKLQKKEDLLQVLDKAESIWGTEISPWQDSLWMEMAQLSGLEPTIESQS